MFVTIRKSSALKMALVGLVAAFTLGCGDTSSNSGDFVYTGTGQNTATTGNVNFQFQRLLAQGTVELSADVPAGTQSLSFDFFNADAIGEAGFIHSDEAPFAESVTLQGVPANAVFVVITAYDGNDFPLSTISDEVEVVAGGESAQDLSDAESAPVAFESVIVSPNPVNLNVDGTRQLAVAAEFSNGDVVPTTPSNADFDSDSDAIATVSEAGVVTAEAPGETVVSASLTIRELTRTGEAEVVVAEPTME